MGIVSPMERGWLPTAIGFGRISSLITESKYGHSLLIYQSDNSERMLVLPHLLENIRVPA
jgi:hypothetical protein